MPAIDGTAFRRGDIGPAVAEIRSLLDRLGLLNGSAPRQDSFDASLELAVRAFQQQRGLTVDGIVGPSTYRRLDEARWQLGDRVLNHRPGALLAGDDVFALQQRLLDLGFKVGRVDGYFGAETEAGLRELQRNLGLPVDGTCGPATLKALNRLQPRVSGGAPNTLRAEERIRTAGPRLAGKIVVVDPMPLLAVPPEHEARARADAIVGDVARRVEGRLVAIGVQAYLAGRPGEAYDDASRAAFANRADADLTLSLTLDASTNPDAAGVASYFFGSDTHGTRSSVGERFAGLVQREIVARTDSADLRTHAKTWDFLRLTRMPAVRLDLGYLTNLADATRLSRPAFRDTLAEAIVVAIQRFYLAPEVDPNTGVLQFAELREAVRQPRA
ncbi:N-acetylmuramoyl-L-alanine amidase [Nocardioides mangrovicus]|uniref:N-acetylmuramoyl-L-alanine amidase n=1 Tax=Nocardioides mangrovicus TaxID=2478913 RepID=UPI001E5D8227|nr:peptidoglycan-binding protein [Nocardioides mangrovicus]